MLIALEGIDGAGTSTQLSRVQGLVERHGGRCHVTHEPTATPVGRLIRRALAGEVGMGGTTLALLYAADRLEHLRTEIEPRLAEGMVVVTDRYVLSSLAYQSCDIDSAWVAELNRFVRLPDLTLFLRVSPTTAAARRDARGTPPERFDKMERQIHVAENYETLVRAGTWGPVEVLDAEQSVDAVTRDLERALAPTLGWSVPS